MRALACVHMRLCRERKDQNEIHYLRAGAGRPSSQHHITSTFSNTVCWDMEGGEGDGGEHGKTEEMKEKERIRKSKGFMSPSCIIRLIYELLMSWMTTLSSFRWLIRGGTNGNLLAGLDLSNMMPQMCIN